MGNYTYGYGYIHITKENQAPAIEKLKKSSFTNKDGTTTPCLEVGRGNPSHIDTKNLCSILKELFSLEAFVEESGDINAFDFSNEYDVKACDIKACDILGLIAEFMDPGAKMSFHNNTPSLWRVIFDPTLEKGYRIEKGVVLFPSDIVGNELGVQHIFKVYICGEGDEPFEVGNATTEGKAAQMEETLRAHGFAVMPRDRIQLDVLVLDDEEINF